MKTLKNTPTEVKTAHAIWVNTMTKKYPGFDPTLWSKNSTYRCDHPQPAISG